MKCDELKDYDYDPDFPFQSGGRFYDADEADAAIAELKAEITRKEGVGKRWFEQCMEARAENVRTKRALYKACANWADVVAFEKTEGIGYDNSVAERWRKMESKCIKKAKEYKLTK
ncbi:hypothetical protein [Fibrobacter succinogenes]|uniref:hypothetical protein n=1 Tax=Fibrobacter succinogenes TaxID=833 RepID=UPI001568A404|nr:hypothetical protein [Fibrobacter succinogenes]